MSLNKLILAGLCLSLLGCSTTRDGLNRLSPYVGQPVDTFFYRFGMPVAVHEFSDKSRVYRWSSGQRSVHMPAVTSFSGSVTPAGTLAGGSHTFGGFSVSLECILDLQTNPQGVVQQIKAIKDTWGAWETSRCAEVLK
jgi:hypothetical protein